MTFQWISFKTLADELLTKHSSDETAVRVAASRCYYALFNTARAYAIHHYFVSNGASDHRKLPTWLVAHGKPDVAHALRMMRRIRNNCDYDSVLEDTLQSVALNIQANNQIVLTL